MMFDNKKAIRELLNSVIHACKEERHNQAKHLLTEALENCKIAFEDEAASAIGSIIKEMHQSDRIVLLQLWGQVLSSV